jgi:hypothetical protein
MRAVVQNQDPFFYSVVGTTVLSGVRFLEGTWVRYSSARVYFFMGTWLRFCGSKSVKKCTVAVIRVNKSVLLFFLFNN